MSKGKVALALSSGGPRGFAYIGAIEEILRRGYEISSIAGTSAGSLVGGVYAAGGLDAFKEWLFALDPLKVMRLMDFSLSRNYLVKGDRVIKAIKANVPECNIEDLSIPFVAIATDLYTGEEVLFREGPLFDAIRASISIPSMFRPVRRGGRTLVDGGMSNTFPLNRVPRTEGDILVGFNVNRIDAEDIGRFLDGRKALSANEDAMRESALERLRETLSDHEDPVLDRLRVAGQISGKLLRETIRNDRKVRLLESGMRERGIPTAADDNYVSILDRSFGIMNHTIARMAIEVCPPDVLISLPYDSFHGVDGYSRAREIADIGRALTSAALDRFEGCS